MYLREMGSVELLSREGEIAIAKRIEAGREAMIAGLCESPLTFQAIIIWRDELNEGKVFLRDIIDLEATYAGTDAKAMPGPVIGPDGQPVAAAPGAAPVAVAAAPLAQTAAPPAAPAAPTPFKAAGQERGPERGQERGAERANGGGRRRRGGASRPRAKAISTTDDMENSLSLAAIEAELKPKGGRDLRQRGRRLQAAAPPAGPGHRVQAQEHHALAGAERRYKKLKDDIIVAGEIAAAQHRRASIAGRAAYDINKRLVGYEGRMMRLAESHGVTREDFLRNYQGSELDPRRLNRVSKLSARAGRTGRQGQGACEAAPPRDPGCWPARPARDRRVRKIVHMVQKGEREARQAKKEMVEANLRLEHFFAHHHRNRHRHKRPQRFVGLHFLNPFQ